MKAMKIVILLCAFVTLCSTSIIAQDHNISVSGNIGWAIPGGSGVSEAAADLNLDGGLVFGADAIYDLSPNFGVGIGFVNSLLAGAGGGDIDIFGLRTIGAKATYRLKDEGFTPFVGLTIGLSQLLTPEFSITDSNGNTVTVPEETGSGFGIVPELGLSFGKFFVMGQYVLPTSYSIGEVVTDKAVGTLNIVIGYRYPFEF